MSKGAVSGKIVRQKLFKPCEGEPDIWECICGTKRKQTGSSYANLVSHVKSEHPDEYKKLSEDETSFNCSMSRLSSEGHNFFFKRKTQQIYCWIDMVVNALQPFSICTNEAIRRNVKFDPIDRETLAKYMGILTKHVEAKIRELLPK